MKEAGDARRNLEETLVKLRTDYIDVYLLHCITESSLEAIKERGVFDEFQRFKSEGLIRHVGFSYHGGFGGFKSALEYYPWEVAQVQQNFLDVENDATAEAITLAGQRNAACVIMEPLRGGGLSHAPAPVKKLYNAFPVKRSPTEWAFRHLLNYSEVSCVLSGMSEIEQLIENAEIFSKEDAVAGCMTEDEKKLLLSVKAAYESIITIPCTGCGYCMPCPQKVGIPGVFGNYNNGMRFGHFDAQRRSYMFAVNGERDASKCVSCGECVTKCPQNVDIPAQLAAAHEALRGWVE